MYQKGKEPTLKKRNFNFFSFLMSVFMNFSLSLAKNAIENSWYHIKIHGVIAITATTPLLNLNLNYEKLQDKYKY